jgi:hypothetical protein
MRVHDMILHAFRPVEHTMRILVVSIEVNLDVLVIRHPDDGYRSGRNVLVKNNM